MSDLKFKTVGTKREDGSDLKDYAITCDGRTFQATCTKKGKFICPDAGIDRNSSLKDIKMAIAVLIENGDAPEPASRDGSSCPTQTPTAWDAKHPCALLILEISNRFGQFSPEVIETLDVYGWLLDGKPDIARAHREVNR